jgi:hypothetical protein
MITVKSQFVQQALAAITLVLTTLGLFSGPPHYLVALPEMFQIE